MQHQGMILGIHSILLLTKLNAATAIMSSNQTGRRVELIIIYPPCYIVSVISEADKPVGRSRTSTPSHQ